MLKKIPYAKQSIDETDLKAVSQALKTDYLTQGPLVAEFEQKVAAYCGAKYAVALNSGTSALHAACFAAGISANDEVITSPITFVASANCVLYCGGKPVFADIEPETINISPEETKKNITAQTKAIIPVHFAGQPCDLEKIQAIAKKNNLVVIEDACHALGAEYKGSRIGSGKYSDMTVLSFHAIKHITTGEGGMVLTNNEDYYKSLLSFRTHGITREKSLLNNKDEGPWFYEMHHLGYNYRLTDFQSALGISQLTRLEEFVNKRRAIVKQYNSAFKAAKNIIIPGETATTKSSWHIYPIQVKQNRAKIFADLKANGLGVNVHYIPVYLQPYYQNLGYQKGSCPKAEQYYNHAITLPLYPAMSSDEVDYIIEKVIGSVKQWSN